MYRILIVDDDKLIVDDLLLLIDWSRVDCYPPEQASNGALALKKLQSAQFDIVLTDIAMPEMDGVELIRAARQSGIDAVFLVITNLPNNCCVEVPCLVDGTGIYPSYIGELPPQCAALNRTNINVQELTIEAALTGNREHIYHAAFLDPHTAAELDMDHIVAMCDELLAYNRKWLPNFFK